MSDMNATVRRTLRSILALGALAGACCLPLLWTGEAQAYGGKAANAYIGSGKCQNCHDADASGNQWDAWNHAGHSNAFEVLKTDEAKQVAAEMGIEDPTTSEKCLKCHVTGHGLPEKMFKKSFDPAEGVGCEACHGPGNDHQRARFRAANEAEEDEGFGDEEEVTYTEIPADEIGSGITAELCKQCHNSESPTYKPFCYYERVEHVRHLNPLKPRTDEERAAMLVCGCGDACTCDHDCADSCAVPPK